MTRAEDAARKYADLFGDLAPLTTYTDPEFQQILNRFIFGEVYHHGQLADEIRVLITIVLLASNQNLAQLRPHCAAALTMGVEPVALREALYQCAPYIGYPKTIMALAELNQVLQEKGIELPLAPQATVSEEDRLEKGLALQRRIFGEVVQTRRQQTPPAQFHIQEYLAGVFGDYYRREGLDLTTRELLTFCLIASLGGCEAQLRSHIRGNVNVGNDKQRLLEALTHCIPYIGFPRALTALAVLNEVLPD